MSPQLAHHLAVRLDDGGAAAVAALDHVPRVTSTIRGGLRHGGRVRRPGCVPLGAVRARSAEHLASAAGPCNLRGMRGYFGIGIEGVSKPMNLGSLLRTAHAFGASFVFTIGAAFDARIAAAPTPRPPWPTCRCTPIPISPAFSLPHGCRLVGVELVDDAIELPSFRHPPPGRLCAGGRTRQPVAGALVERCDFVVRIPDPLLRQSRLAGALVMYDRMICLGRFAERPVRAGGADGRRPRHVHGEPVWKRSARRAAETPRATVNCRFRPRACGTGSCLSGVQCLS